MNVLEISSANLWIKQRVLVGGALLATISLVALTVFIGLYYSNTYTPPLSLYVLFGPQAGGILLGLTAMIVSTCIKTSKIQKPREEISSVESVFSEEDLISDGQGEIATANPGALGEDIHLIEPELRKKESERWTVSHLMSGGKGEMAKKCADHALKNAATRIFADPLRSFLELIVNALDASLPVEKNVGKFGMGFISILSFLDHSETQGCTISIETTYQEDEKLISYRMDLAKEEGQYVVTIDQQAPSQQTGTLITIMAKEGEFSRKTLNALHHYCQSLQFYEHGKVCLTSLGTSVEFGEGEPILAWVSLEKNQLSVRDLGCGISEKIARSTLFIPSLSSKSKKALQNRVLRLPEFKSYQGKTDTNPHLLIAINGVLVIDIPFKGHFQHDLLIRMPPETQITLARDAVEFSQNRIENITYLKKVIKKTIQQVICQQVDPYLILALYKGLREWESRVSSVAVLRLSCYLESCVQSAFKKHPHSIPYPIDQKDHLLPILRKCGEQEWIPFPSQLLFGHFSQLESLLIDHFQRSATTDLEKKAIDRELISGKSVLFIPDDLLGQDGSVTSLGLKSVIFAAHSLLESYHEEKELQFILINQFVEEGKTLSVAESQRPSSLPQALSPLRGPTIYPIVIKGKKYVHFGKGLKRDISKEGWLAAIPEAVFLEFSKSQKGQYLTNNCAKKFQRIYLPIDLMARTIVKKNALGKGPEGTLARYVLTDNARCWLIKEPEQAAEYIQNQTSLNNKDKLSQFKEIEKQVEACLESDEFKDQFLEEIGMPRILRLHFEWLLSHCLASSETRLVIGGRTIWPLPEEITPQLLHDYFNIFFYEYEPNSWYERFEGISLGTWHGYVPDHWFTLEAFLDYRNGKLAILKLLPLLNLKESLMQRGLPKRLSDHLSLNVQRLIQSYHRFFTIKAGDYISPYGLHRPKERLFSLYEEGYSKWEQFSCTESEQLEFLISLIDRPNLFEKVVTLFAEDLLKRLDIRKREAAWRNNCVGCVPGILDDISFSLLCLLRRRGLDDSYLEIILTYVTNPIELRAICMILLDKKVSQRFIAAKGDDQERCALILKEMITVYLQVKVDQHKLAKAIDPPWVIEAIGITDSSLYDELVPIFQYLENIDATHFEIDQAFIPSIFQEKMERASPFTSQQIIHAAQENENFLEIVRQGDLHQSVTLVRESPLESHLRTIAQSVEHGSERSHVEATLVEAFQNSVDAIREHVGKNPSCSLEKTNISFDVRMIHEDDASIPRLLLAISDQIGMANLKTLLADFLIPNYSEKSKTGMAVGEMGNGSYQMYRDAEMVSVMTRTVEDPAKVYFLCITPLRDENHEVYDLKHQCIAVTEEVDPQFVGTQLRIVLRNEGNISKVGIELEGIAARQLIQATFSIAKPPLVSNRRLKVTLRLPDHKTVLLSALDDQHLPFMTHSPFTFYKMQNERANGYVLTDGYPFMPLSHFLKEEGFIPSSLIDELTRGWVLSIPVGHYKPVQSRTHLQLNEGVKKELKYFLADWIYYRSFLKDSNALAAHYYPHFESPCFAFDQVFPGRVSSCSQDKMRDDLFVKGDFQSLELFFKQFIPSFMKKSFCAWIQEAYGTLVVSLDKRKHQLLAQLEKELGQDRETRYQGLIDGYRRDCDQIFQEWKDRLAYSNEYEKQFIRQILVVWFEKKVTQFISSPPSLACLIEQHTSLQTTEEKIQKEEALKNIERELNGLSLRNLIVKAHSIIQSYCEIYATYVPLVKGPHPRAALFCDFNDNSSASYNTTIHTVKVNLAHCRLSEILEMGKRIARLQTGQSDQLIAIRPGSSGILNHELEHARRGDSCLSCDVHGYGRAADGKYADFESCAASYARQAYQKGMMSTWSKSLNQSDLPTDEEIALLKKLEQLDLVTLSRLY